MKIILASILSILFVACSNCATTSNGEGLSAPIGAISSGQEGAAVEVPIGQEEQPTVIGEDGK